jgi:Ca2+-binding RTX toxin-like protein
LTAGLHRVTPAATAALQGVIVAQELGFHLVNDREVPVRAGVPLVLGAGDDRVSVWSTLLAFNGLAIPVVRLGAGDDIVGGHPGVLFGGTGDDTFTLRGVAEPPFDAFPGVTHSRAYGGAGNDAFTDRSGSTIVYGGAGDDSWTNLFVTTTSTPGDEDRVHLGRGNDSAKVVFSRTDPSAPFGLEDRTIHLDGGAGYDRLVLADLHEAFTPRVLNLAGVSGRMTELGHTTFTGFEAFAITADADAFDMLRLGAGDDALAMRFYRSRDAVASIHGGAGDDVIIGPQQQSGECFVFGGAGDDTITGGGGTGGPEDPWTDRLSGGKGNDMLFLTGVQAVNHGFAEMTGGKGRDLFAVSAGGRFAHAVITDFAPGADRIVIDRTGGHAINGPDPRGAAAVPARMEVLQDDGEALHLWIGFTNVFGIAERFFVHYDRETGALTGEVGRAGLRPDDHDLVAILEGAPRLTADHMLLLDF